VTTTAKVSEEQVKAAASMSPLPFLPPRTRVQRKGPSNWLAQCPFHDDRNPSLSITECSDGRWRYKCHGCGEIGDPITLIQKTRNMSFVEAVNTLTAAAKNAPLRPEIDCCHDYVDETGKLLYQVVRYRPKDFKVRTPLPNGEWCYRKPPKLVPYRLYEIIKDDPHMVYLVEGEKDADAIARKSGYASTWAFGATAWKDDYARWFAGKTVVTIPDMDDVGRAAMRKAYEALEPVAKRLGYVLLSTGKDVSDYFEAGKGLIDLNSEIVWTKE